MPSRRSREEKNCAKKITKLNDDCCVGKSQDIEERHSFHEAHEKKTCDRKRYKADPESKKDSMKAQYWLDSESKKESAKAQYWLDPESKKESVKVQYWLDPESKESTKAQYWLDPESKKESVKAQYCLDLESKKDSVKAYYDQNRELILASKQDQYQANPKAKRGISRINSRRKRNPMR